MVMSPSLFLSSLKLSIMSMLLVSIFFFTKSYIYVKKSSVPLSAQSTGVSMNRTEKTIVSYNSGPFTINVLKALAFFSLLSLFTAVYLDFQTLKMTLSFWLNKTPTKISLQFVYDQYFLVFLAVALFVTWSIMEFSYYYMDKDPNGPAFYRLLSIFLLKMLMLTCSNSLFLIFLGWEGVGFLSFLLISWWSTRKDASSSALEAVIYNRMGDMGLMTFMALSVLLFNSWNLTEILSSKMSSSHFLPFLLFGLMLAAAGKSAQFGLHPWLPAAMEGPTPVSALLHSSTMVVAGVFLLIRTSDLFMSSPPFQTFVLVLGGTTALFAATTAMAQHDMKKIIAYSTTSQLGLMVTALGLGQPLLAFFHICTHAFFKAMLFLCSGSIIHSLKDEQDLRKMSGLSNLLPVTSACLTLGSLALMGTPFLAGFYSKDLILEAASGSLLKTLGLVLALLATLLTAVYSFRMVFFCFLSNPTVSPLAPMKEENPNLMNSLIRLASGTMISGWMFSNFVLVPPSFIITSPAKSMPLMVTVLGTALLLTILSFLVKTMLKKKTHKTFTNQWFYVEIVHSITASFIFFSSLFFYTRTLDRGWQEKVGPQGVGSTTTSASKANQVMQSGLVKRYMTSSIMSMMTIVVIIFLITS